MSADSIGVAAANASDSSDSFVTSDEKNSSRELISNVSVILPKLEASTFDKLLKVVCIEFGVQRADIMGRERFRHIASARHVSIYLARVMLGWSFPWLGRMFGHKDHTSIMHAFYKIDRFVKNDAQWKTLLELLQERVRVATDIPLPPVLPPRPKSHAEVMLSAEPKLPSSDYFPRAGVAR
jgi:hypothetical protein